MLPGNCLLPGMLPGIDSYQSIPGEFKKGSYVRFALKWLNAIKESFIFYKYFFNKVYSLLILFSTGTNQTF